MGSLCKLMMCITLLASVSCSSDKKRSDGEEALEAGYIYVDGGGVVHFDKHCKRAIKNVLLIQPKESGFREICSCVPIDCIEDIKEYKR